MVHIHTIRLGTKLSIFGTDSLVNEHNAPSVMYNPEVGNLVIEDGSQDDLSNDVSTYLKGDELYWLRDFLNEVLP